MNHYWARFEKHNKDLFRFDTRVYLRPIDKPCKEDICIGAIIGKNPGSAQPSDFKNATLQPINLGNDKFLPIARNIMIKAHEKAGINLDNCPNKYIQILNLFYLCDNTLKDAITKIKPFLPDHPICCSENKKFNFIFYSWGGSNAGINTFKNRFLDKPKTNRHIWYDKNCNKVKYVIPQIDDFAKHLIGLSHDAIVHGITKKLKETQ